MPAPAWPAPVAPKDIRKSVESVIGGAIHAKQVLSLANGVARERFDEVYELTRGYPLAMVLIAAIQGLYEPESLEDHRIDEAIEDDWPEIRKMVAENEGPRSLELLDHWRSNNAKNVVCRGKEGAPRRFCNPIHRGWLRGACPPFECLGGSSSVEYAGYSPSSRGGLAPRLDDWGEASRAPRAPTWRPNFDQPP